MVLGKLPVRGRPTIWMIVGQGPIALAVGAGEGCLDIFTLLYHFSSLFPSLWEMARYRLKYCLKGPLHPKQPTNQPSNYFYKGKQLLYFLFYTLCLLPMTKKALPKWGLVLKERICSYRSKFFPLRVDPHSERLQK